MSPGEEKEELWPAMLDRRTTSPPSEKVAIVGDVVANVERAMVEDAHTRVQLPPVTRDDVTATIARFTAFSTECSLQSRRWLLRGNEEVYAGRY